MKTTKWVVDPMHSEVQFKVKHLVISTVTGQFKEFNAELESEDENFENAHTNFSAKIDSISTNNNDRDAHLKSPDFFDAASYPELSFRSNKFVKNGSDSYDVIGDLTIKGTTKEVVLKGEFGGTMTDFYGNQKAGFEFTGKINRQDFGLTWSAVTEAGGIVVSDEVKLALNLQFMKAN